MLGMTTIHSFEVRKDDLQTTRWVSQPAPPLAPGQVRLAIEHFALTANNITYAAFGEAMSYWGFFPSDDATDRASWGRIPVWGFAVVAASTTEGVAVGERVYGCFPMASHCVLQPVRVNDKGFMDGAPHRRELHPVYNQYVLCRSDPAYLADREPEQALLRPLFFTSWLIDDFLADNAFFGAQQVLLSSASSKTAYGTAWCLKRRGDVQVVGLTSAANKPFVESLGCYDRVVTYDQVPHEPAVPSVYVDMAGSGPLRLAVHTRFGDALSYSCSVGGTHVTELSGAKGLPGPKPILFFAPAQIKKRSEDWGAAELGRRFGVDSLAFVKTVTNAAKPWLQVAWHRGEAEIAQVYQALLAGRVPAQTGLMLSVQP
jgi:hypothetical protein